MCGARRDMVQAQMASLRAEMALYGRRNKRGLAGVRAGQEPCQGRRWLQRGKGGGDGGCSMVEVECVKRSLGDWGRSLDTYVPFQSRQERSQSRNRRMKARLLGLACQPNASCQPRLHRLFCLASLRYPSSLLTPPWCCSPPRNKVVVVKVVLRWGGEARHGRRTHSTSCASHRSKRRWASPSPSPLHPPQGN